MINLAMGCVPFQCKVLDVHCGYAFQTVQYICRIIPHMFSKRCETYRFLALRLSTLLMCVFFEQCPRWSPQSVSVSVSVLVKAMLQDVPLYPTAEKGIFFNIHGSQLDSRSPYVLDEILTSIREGMRVADTATSREESSLGAKHLLVNDELYIVLTPIPLYLIYIQQ